MSATYESIAAKRLWKQVNQSCFNKVVLDLEYHSCTYSKLVTLFETKFLVIAQHNEIQDSKWLTFGADIWVTVPPHSWLVSLGMNSTILFSPNICMGKYAHPEIQLLSKLQRPLVETTQHHGSMDYGNCLFLKYYLWPGESKHKHKIHYSHL